MKLELQLNQEDFTVPTETPFPTTPLPTTTDHAREGSDLLARVVQGAHHTIDRLADTAAPHVQKLQEGISSAGETVSARAEQARDTGEEWAQRLRSTVREHPLAALAAALAVGMVVARITR